MVQSHSEDALDRELSDDFASSEFPAPPQSQNFFAKNDALKGPALIVVDDALVDLPAKVENGEGS